MIDSLIQEITMTIKDENTRFYELTLIFGKGNLFHQKFDKFGLHPINVKVEEECLVLNLVFSNYTSLEESYTQRFQITEIGGYSLKRVTYKTDN